MKYQYNYSFLRKWFKANGDITDRMVLEAIGTNSNNSLAQWETCKSPMSVINLLRFCNTFQVPLSAFIVDTDRDWTRDIVKIDANAQLEPDGGYLERGQKRAIGSRGLRNPLDVDIIPSVVPGWEKDSDSLDTDGDSVEETRKEDTMPVIGAMGDVATIWNLERERIKQDAARISQESIRIEQEARYSKERERLLNVIADQQKQIADLTRMLHDEMSKNTKLSDKVSGFGIGNIGINNIGIGNTGIGLVADEVHHDNT